MKANVGKLEVKEVNARMKKLCTNCGDLPSPTRLDITTGAGKWQKTKTLCSDCAKEWFGDLHSRLDELQEAMGDVDEEEG